MGLISYEAFRRWLLGEGGEQPGTVTVTTSEPPATHRFAVGEPALQGIQFTLSAMPAMPVETSGHPAYEAWASGITWTGSGASLGHVYYAPADGGDWAQVGHAASTIYNPPPGQQLIAVHATPEPPPEPPALDDGRRAIDLSGELRLR